MTDGYPLRLVMFDCDGTLIDSQHAIIAAMGEAFDAMSLQAPSHEQTRRIVGLTLDEAIQTLMPSETRGDEALLATGVDAYKASFLAQRSRPDHHEPLYPGTEIVLRKLHKQGALLGVATGKARRGLDAVLARHKLAELFTTLQTPDNNPGKPHPGMLHTAMNETGAEVAQTVMIGDTSYDIEMAKAAGVTAVGVSWGYHAVDELRAAGADEVIDRYEQLPDVLDVLMGAAT